MKRMRIKEVGSTPLPTLGETLKNLLDWSDIWLCLDPPEDPSRKNRRRLYDKLRKIEEESEIHSLGHIETFLGDALDQAIPNKTLSSTILSAIIALLGALRLSSAIEINHLPRDMSMRAMMHKSPFLLTRLFCLSQFLPWQQYSTGPKIYFPEDEFWFLPSKEGGEWVMPRRKVLQWWKMKNHFESNEALASRIKGTWSDTTRTLYNWEKTGIRDSQMRGSLLQAILTSENNLGLKGDAEGMQASLGLLLLYSNIMDRLCAVVINNYGDSTLELFLSNLKELFSAYREYELPHFESVIDKFPQPKDAGRPTEHDHEQIEAWLEELKNAEERRAASWLEACMDYEQNGNFPKTPGNEFATTIIRCLEKTYPEWAEETDTLDDYFRTVDQLIAEIGIEESSDRLFKFLSEINELRAKAKDLGRVNYLCDYAEGLLLLRLDNFRESKDSLHRAFMKGRYSAGRRIVTIIESNMIVAAYCHQNARTLGIPKCKKEIEYLWKWIRHVYPFEVIPIQYPKSILPTLVTTTKNEDGNEVEDIIPRDLISKLSERIVFSNDALPKG